MKINIDNNIDKLLSLDWMNEKVDKFPNNNWMYKFACFITGKRKAKMTFKEVYLMLVEINSIKGVDMNKVKEASLNNILYIYKFQNNKLPDELVRKSENDK